MSYQLYLLKQGSAPSPLFKSHWALFVLLDGDFAQGTAVGTSIHVTGSLFAGFTFEVKRNWGQTVTDETFRSILIGEVPASSVALPESIPPITEFILDSEAKSPLEKALLTEPAPGKSLRSAGGGGALELKDCQWWIRQALPHAVAQGHVQLVEGTDQVLAVQ
ncbi:hypothetical protein M413DRAFT_449679 [Hebeloma cylindrosporum]|uniref:Uncharacterized protein n=1 Tax=Hebeloma cylindrosporum TaxID=76867 RepID=A0A0C3BVV3_HEBCY|nr:hypothetical protein M413DRAFT_449679 [Hebeloma cylindrosporum h7]